MRRLTVVICGGILFAGIAAAQSDQDLAAKDQPTESNRNSTNARLAEGSTLPATLTKTVDSKKLKKGDPVTARTIAATKENGRTVIPADSLIQGHVTQASSREKGDSFSTLGIVFDRAVLKNGEEMPITVIVQAIALPASAVNGPPNPGGDTAPLGNGPPQGGAERQAPASRPAAMPPSQPTVPDTVGNTSTNQATPDQSIGSIKAGLNDNGVLKPDSRGVYGLRGIGLATSSDGQQAAVITSTDKSVHLDSGTQLLLVSQSATAQTSTR
jgi:hypothetical protein